VTQALQVAVQERVLRRVLANDGSARPGAMLRCLDRVRMLQRIPGYLIGVGIRPEHVRSPADVVRRPLD
jgi:hypothetical protein